MKILCFVVMFFLCGCATTSSVSDTEPIQNTFEINKPFNSVWKAIVATFAEHSYPIKAIEKDSGLITTDFIVFADGIMADDEIKGISKRPSLFMGTWTGGRYTISIYAQQIDSKITKIKITPHIEAYESNLSNSWHTCNSKGVLEKEIYDFIMDKLK